MGSGRIRGNRPGGDSGAELRLGVTGHIHISAKTGRLVARELTRQLSRVRERMDASRTIVGVSCLAPGADSVFAQVLLDLGGRLEVILPTIDYGRSLTADRDAVTFADLLRRAVSVRAAAPGRPSTAAYVAANDAMLDSIDHLYAVWDGVESGAPGSTAHVVATARSRRLPITVVWPEGARRSSNPSQGANPPAAEGSEALL